MARSNSTNSAFANTVISRKSSKRALVGADFSNRLFSKQSHPVFFSAQCHGIVATLTHHVRSIVCMRTKKKVCWVHANSVVAMMTNQQPLWNWTVTKFKGHPVGQSKPREFSPRKLPIANISSDRANPFPTRIRLPDLAFKCTGQRAIRMIPLSGNNEHLSAIGAWLRSNFGGHAVMI